MSSVCFIPIKENSERVPGKNLRVLNGKKLYRHIFEHVKEAAVFDEIFVDTNSDEVARFADGMGFGVIERKPELLKRDANGNDLLTYHYSLYPDFDCYFQLFATAPFLQPKSIRSCYEQFISNAEYDSCFTAVKNYSFYWFRGIPMNYRPEILPRSQDMEPVVEETTGLYGINAKSLKRYHSRIGIKPLIYFVNRFEAVDINTEDDFKVAEFVGKAIFGL